MGWLWNKTGQPIGLRRLFLYYLVAFLHPDAAPAGCQKKKRFSKKPSIGE
jgi:hypothetical protein